MKASMRKPRLWRVRVHENLGWFVGLEHIPSGGLLTVSPSYDQKPVYGAMLSLTSPHCGDCRWTDVKSFKSPQAAVDHVVKLAGDVLRAESIGFSAITAGLL